MCSALQDSSLLLQIRTGDVGGDASTSEFISEVLRHLDNGVTSEEK